MLQCNPEWRLAMPPPIRRQQPRRIETYEPILIQHPSTKYEDLPVIDPGDETGRDDLYVVADAAWYEFLILP